MVTMMKWFEPYDLYTYMKKFFPELLHIAYIDAERYGYELGFIERMESFAEFVKYPYGRKSYTVGKTTLRFHIIDKSAMKAWLFIHRDIYKYWLL